MRLFHVSEELGIEAFEPRLPTAGGAGVSGSVVWAVAESHLVNYLLPRECPRVTFHVNSSSTQADRDHFLGSASHVVAIEQAWLSKANETELWLYELPAEAFVCSDSNAGYFTSPVTVVPAHRRHVRQPLVELAQRGAELRVLPELHSLAKEVARSTLAFSLIRMRNALPLRENAL